MKIATFNINNINRRLPNLLAWLKARQPDVVCLQELKATDRQFPRTAIAEAGYGAAFVGQSAWNGVAILARGVEPVVTQTALPGDPDDDQARYIEAAVDGIIIASLYAPNGNPQPGPKYVYKLAWMLEKGIPCNTEAAECKLFCTETQVNIAMQGMRLLGGYGLTEDFNMARAFREGMGAITGGGTSNIQRNIIARNLLRGG